MKLERFVGARSWRALAILSVLHRSEQIHSHAEKMFRVKQGATWDPVAGTPKKRPAERWAKGSSLMGGKHSQGIKTGEQAVSVPLAPQEN